jgi:DNA invertase Pin-like site-specific DNA recombinase
MQAIGYARWSSLEQGHGSSLERQSAAIHSFCKSKGWDLIEQISDEGVSAYSGANINNGNLSNLVGRIERGLIPAHIVIFGTEPL